MKIVCLGQIYHRSDIAFISRSGIRSVAVSLNGEVAFSHFVKVMSHFSIERLLFNYINNLYKHHALIQGPSASFSILWRFFRSHGMVAKGWHSNTAVPFTFVTGLWPTVKFSSFSTSYLFTNSLTSAQTCGSCFVCSHHRSSRGANYLRPGQWGFLQMGLLSFSETFSHKLLQEGLLEELCFWFLLVENQGLDNRCYRVWLLLNPTHIITNVYVQMYMYVRCRCTNITLV